MSMNRAALAAAESSEMPRSGGSIVWRYRTWRALVARRRAGRKPPRPALADGESAARA